MFAGKKNFASKGTEKCVSGEKDGGTFLQTGKVKVRCDTGSIVVKVLTYRISKTLPARKLALQFQCANAKKLVSLALISFLDL